jgi:hypothetical protein
MRAMTAPRRLRLVLGLCLCLIASGCATTYVGVDAGPHAAAGVPTSLMPVGIS